MNREILFRGKRVDNGEWVEGDLVHQYWLEQDYFMTCAIRYKIGVLYSFPIEVHPETVGEFTGLLDKNGNKIFEGDKCMFYWERPSKGGYMQMSDSTVEERQFAYYTWHLTGFALKNTKTGKHISVPRDCTITIIGKIHDDIEIGN